LQRHNHVNEALLHSSVNNDNIYRTSGVSWQLTHIKKIDWLLQLVEWQKKNRTTTRITVPHRQANRDSANEQMRYLLRDLTWKRPQSTPNTNVTPACDLATGRPFHHPVSYQQSFKEFHFQLETFSLQISWEFSKKPGIAYLLEARYRIKARFDSRDSWKRLFNSSRQEESSLELASNKSRPKSACSIFCVKLHESEAFQKNGF
jgi:hypothetical protein